MTTSAADLKTHRAHTLLPAGGLGDVMGALPKALARRGHRVMVVVPRYGNYAEGWETGVRRRFRVFNAEQEVRCMPKSSHHTPSLLTPL